MQPMFSTVLLAALSLCACSPSPTSANADPKASAAPGDMAMADAEHAKMSKASATPAAEMPKMASATGSVEAVDAAAGKITIAHGAVDALQWPAMTMAFKATPEQIASVRIGQKVNFEFQSQGMDATISRIEPVK